MSPVTWPIPAEKRWAEAVAAAGHRPVAWAEALLAGRAEAAAPDRIASWWAMALAGANIVGAQIFTMSNGMALDTFTIQEAPMIEGHAPAAFAEPSRLARLATQIEQSLSGRIKLREQLAKRKPWQSRTRIFTVPPRVFVDNAASVMHTLVEVNGRDRVGFLYDVTRAITELGLQISTAKIMTWGERVVDVFYVKDVFGHKIVAEGKLKATKRWTVELPRQAIVFKGALSPMQTLLDRDVPRMNAMLKRMTEHLEAYLRGGEETERLLEILGTPSMKRGGDQAAPDSDAGTAPTDPTQPPAPEGGGA